MTSPRRAANPNLAAEEHAHKPATRGWTPALSAAMLIAAFAAPVFLPTLSEAEAASSFVQRMILNRFDKNRDGAITIEEFGALQSRIFAKLDQDRDGSLSMPEFSRQEGRRNERRAAGFVRLDQDRNNRLSQAEFSLMAPIMFERMDGNRDGRLTAEEIMAARERSGSGQ